MHFYPLLFFKSINGYEFLCFDFIILVHFPSKGVEVGNFRKVQKAILRSGSSFNHYLWFINQKYRCLNWLKIVEGKTSGKHSDTSEEVCKGWSRGLVIMIIKIATIYRTPVTYLAAWCSFQHVFWFSDTNWVSNNSVPFEHYLHQIPQLKGLSPTRRPTLQMTATRPGPPILLTNGYKFGGSHNSLLKFNNLLGWLTELETM